MSVLRVKPAWAELDRGQAISARVRAYWALDEASGAPRDQMRQSQLTLTGPVWAATPWGAGLDFDGSNDYASEAQDGRLAPTALTAVALVRADTKSGSHHIVSVASGATWSSPFLSWMLRIEAGSFRVLAVNGTTIYASTYQLAAADVTLGQWYTAGIRVGGGALQLWLNGRQIESVAFAAGGVRPSTQPIAIGSRSGTDPGEYLDGRVAGLAVFDGLLSATQMQELHDDFFGLVRPRSPLALLSAALASGGGPVTEQASISESRTLAMAAPIGQVVGSATVLFSRQLSDQVAALAAAAASVSDTVTHAIVITGDVSSGPQTVAVAVTEQRLFTAGAGAAAVTGALVSESILRGDLLQARNVVSVAITEQLVRSQPAPVSAAQATAWLSDSRVLAISAVAAAMAGSGVAFSRVLSASIVGTRVIADLEVSPDRIVRVSAATRVVSAGTPPPPGVVRVVSAAPGSDRVAKA